MTVIVGFSFPEEAVIVSDSRISFIKNNVVCGTQDNLRKILTLTPQLAIGFTSDNVDLTFEIIIKLQKYIKDLAMVNIVYHLLHKLPKVAIHEYRMMTKKDQNPPNMEFMYAGILSDRPLNLPEPLVMKILTQSGGGGAVPEPIGRALMTMKDGYLTIQSPTPVILKQHLPSGRVSNMGIWTVDSIGSGSSIQNLFEKEYSRIMTSEPAPVGSFRSNLIRLMCDNFIRDSHIATIGGAVQILRINSKGTDAINSSFNRIFTDGKTREISSMKFDGEKWISTDYETGKIEIIKSYFPPLKKNL